ncbi:MAG: hypothetical protein ACK5ZG_03935 [Phycisphaerae bacterium]
MHRLHALLTLLISLMLGGCSSAIIIGPSPELPVVTSTMYSDVSLGLTPGDTAAVRYAPVGVRMTAEGLGVDILIESRGDEGPTLARQMSDAGTFGYGEVKHRWLRLRDTTGQELLLNTGAPAHRKDNNWHVMVSFVAQWAIDAGTRDGIRRTLTTVLFHKPQHLSPAQLDVTISEAPPLSQLISPDEAHRFEATYYARQLATSEAARAPEAAAWNEWTTLPVQRVKPWRKQGR